MPASAEVVFELAQRSDAQFLLEVGVLLLFGRQHLLQRADLLLQLDTHTKREKALLNGAVVRLLSSCYQHFECVATYFK